MAEPFVVRSGGGYNRFRRRVQEDVASRGWRSFARVAEGQFLMEPPPERDGRRRAAESRDGDESTLELSRNAAPSSQKQRRSYGGAAEARAASRAKERKKGIRRNGLRSERNTKKAKHQTTLKQRITVVTAALRPALRRDAAPS